MHNAQWAIYTDSPNPLDDLSQSIIWQSSTANFNLVDIASP